MTEPFDSNRQLCTYIVTLVYQLKSGSLDLRKSLAFGLRHDSVRLSRHTALLVPGEPSEVCPSAPKWSVVRMTIGRHPAEDGIDGSHTWSAPPEVDSNQCNYRDPDLGEVRLAKPEALR